MKKTSVRFGLLTILAIAIFTASHVWSTTPVVPTSAPLESAATTAASIDTDFSKESLSQSAETTNSGSQKSQTTVASTTSKAAMSVSLLVEGTRYTTRVPEGSTVLDAMRSIPPNSGFSFEGKEYPSLGYFVDSINGKKHASGLYWFLYVNGTSSDTGASQTTLKDGDVIEWRYQKNY